MTHFSHAYREGCSVGFTFVGHAGDPQVARQVYDRLWTEALSAASRAGATISHHHGIGRAKTRFMDAEHGTSLTLLRALKATLDPAGILNPGVLGLP
jgi:alkyldihydroxyacetonephosphate synthase